jgi:molybdopterin/thiamine biosynthesis adenylyltransferase
MSRHQRKYDLRRTLVSHGFKRDRASTDEFRYVGKLRAAGRAISVAITFPDLEFTRLPKATLLHPEQEAPNVVAHLSTSGDLCFARDEDIVLDRYNVGGTALLCLELAQRGLERALTHKHVEDEIAGEFPQHWDGSSFFYDVAAKQSAPAKLFTVPRGGRHAVLLLTDRASVLKRLVPDSGERKPIESRVAPAFVLSAPVNLTFKRDFRHPSTLKEFLDWLESVYAGQSQTVLEELARPNPKPPATIFIQAPNGCVGIRIAPKALAVTSAQRRQGLVKLLQAQAPKTRVERYSGARFDLSHIFSRNMNNQKPLLRRRIALIGCGTIGSHLAKLLVQSGAAHEDGTLLLLDNQTLRPGNVGRHYLGLPSVGELKATALKRQLKGLFPDANILDVATDAVSYLGNLRGCELVIDATGEEALSFSINDYFVGLRTKGAAPDVLHVRLFGNGVAAQALLVNGFDYACLKCRKPKPEGKWYDDPRKTGVEATPMPAACGEGLFIAYGVAAPVMAAAVALQLVLDWNSGTPAPLLRTVRVDPSATVEVKNKSPRRTEGCPACGQYRQE